MIGDALVFDCVAHIFNFDKQNAFGQPGEMFSNHLYAFHSALTPDDQPKLPPEEFLRQWTVGEIDQMVYDQSDTDMLCAMPLPLTDLFKDGLSPWEECAELRRATPGPHRLLGFGQPSRRAQGDRPHGAPSRRVQREGVQVLQRSL